MNYSGGHKKGERGQAVVLVTLGMIAMLGMMSLAVDLGWAFFVRQAEQAAADAAALAAVRQSVSQGCPYSTPAACTYSSMETIARAYATSNGFTTGGANNNITVTVNAPATGAPPGLGLNSCGGTTVPPCIESYITVNITENVPQLFAAVIGHPTAKVGVTSIGVVSREVVAGSVVATNRYADLAPSSALPVGTDLYQEGAFLGFAYGLQANMGIVLSSTCGGSNCSGAYAGDIGSGLFGSGSVAAPFTQILGTNKNGWVNNSGAWSSTPINVASGNQFDDPFRGAGQPPIPTTVSTVCPTTVCTNGPSPGVALPNAAIAGGTAASPKILPSGSYWVANSSCTKNPCTATGGQITLGSGYFEFVNTSGTPNTFGTFIFYGGLNIGASSHVTFGPGMYIFAGSNQSCSTGAPCPELTVTQGAQICDGPLNNPFCGQTWSPAASNAGEIFVFTGSTSGSSLTYPGLPANPGPVTTCACLTYGQAGIYVSSGVSGASTGINLHGMNASNSNLPTATGHDLQPFTPVLMWQDQGNSHIAYTSTGFVSTSSCSGSLNLPCANPGVSGTSLSPQLNLFLGLGWSGVVSNYSGTIYQPRGAWTNIVMNPDTVSFLTPDPVPLQIISGATILQPAPVSILTGLILDNMTNPPPATHIATALVQ